MPAPTDAAAQLTALVKAQESIVPFLRKQTLTQLQALRPTATALYGEIAGQPVDRDNRFALLYTCADLADVYLRDSAAFAEVVPRLLPLPQQPGLEDWLLRQHLGYDVLMRLANAGVLDVARVGDYRYLAYDLPRYPFQDGDRRLQDTPRYERLFAYPETVPAHLPLLFHQGANLREAPLSQWRDLLARLVKEGHVTRDKLIDWTFAMTTDGSDLHEEAGYQRKGEIEAIGWYFDHLRALKPTAAELLPHQTRVLELLSSPIPGARNAGAAFAKTLGKSADLDVPAYLRVLEDTWSETTTTLAKSALVTLGSVRKAKPASRDAVAAWTATAGQHPEEKIRALVAAFAEKQGFAAVTVEAAPRERAEGERPEDQIDKINKLLSSPDVASVRVGLQLVDADNFSPELLEAVFLLTRVFHDGATSEAADELLRRHGSPALLAVAERDFDLHSEATEETIRKNIKKYTKDNELDPLRLARALYRKTGKGIVTLLDAVDEEEQAALVRNFVRGATFDMRGTGLTKLPKALVKFPELEVIDARDNYLGSLPASIKVFTKLKQLLLGGNRLKSVNANVGQLPALEVLDLSENAITGQPAAALFTAPKLRDLNLAEAFTYELDARTLPPEFFEMQHLERLSLVGEGRKRVFGNFPNFPSLESEDGPLVLDALQVSRDRLSSNSHAAAAYLLRHGNADDRRAALRALYDEDTATLTLANTHLSRLPDELAELDPAHLVLDRWLDERAYGGALYDGEKSARFETEASTALSRLPGLRSLTFRGRNMNALSPLSASAHLEALHFDYFELARFALGLPHPERLRRLTLSNGFRTDPSPHRDRSLAEVATFTGLEHVEVGFGFSFEDEAMAALRAVLPEGCEVGKR